MRGEFDDRRDDIRRHLGILVFGGADRTAAIPREAEALAGARRMVQFARRDIVAHAVDLVVGEPEVAGPRIEILADGVPDAGREDLAVLAVAVDADDAADPVLHVLVGLLGRRNVEGLAERDVELVVRPDIADARRVVEGFLVGGDQIALLDHVPDRHVRALVEELGRREHHHPVLLGDVEEAVLGEADAVRDDEVDGRREPLHFVGDAVLVAVRDDPHVVLARADENRDPLRADSHMAGVRNDCEEFDLETVRNVDIRKVCTKLVGIFTRLLDRFEVGGRSPRRLHRAELLQVVLCLCE